MIKPHWRGRSALFTGYLFAIPWRTPFVSFDRNSLRPTWRRFTRLAWFIGHVNDSLLNRQDEPASLKATTAFATDQRDVGIRSYKELPSTLANRVLIILKELLLTVNRTEGHLYFGAGRGLGWE
ncbi:hypothetical protein SAMN05428952_100927 [Nitrosomonas sp. Nm132]|nr:hypothetical protein SAMN05428952_100927 [Nitrosomonas sp. Nm132]